MKHLFTALLLIVATIGHAADEPTPETIKHRIIGLFEPARADHLRALFKDHPKVKLLSIDFTRAEGTFSYDPKTCSETDIDQWIHARTFRIRPASTTPADKLTTVEIAVLALDCKGCCFAMHNFLINEPGVEQATPHMEEGTITALIDPTKTNQAALETALKKSDVQLKEAPKPAAPK